MSPTRLLTLQSKPIPYLHGPSFHVKHLARQSSLPMSTLQLHTPSVYIIYASSPQPYCLALEKVLGMASKFQKPTEGLTLHLLQWIQHRAFVVSTWLAFSEV